MSAGKAIVAVGLLLMGCDLVQTLPGEYHARLQDAGGLREGAVVYVAGVRMGRVGAVSLDGDRARVAFTINEDAGVTVREDSCVAVRWYGNGEAHLRLRPGSEGKPPLASGSEIPCVEEISVSAETAVAQVRDLLTDWVSGKGTIGRLLRDEELAGKVERFFERGAACGDEAPAVMTAGSAMPARPAGSAAPPPARSAGGLP